MVSIKTAAIAQGNFARWQPEYAKHRIPIFPVAVTATGKKPLVRGYLNTTIARAAEFAKKFGDSESFGFNCGARTGLTVVDMDSTDPAIVGEAERLFGESPLLWRTGSGKFAAAFRHNGERRRIRPIRSLPIDLLGGGFAVAPPSAGTLHAYEIIKGNLADLERLPVARIPDEIAQDKLRSRPAEFLTPEGQRHELLKNLLKAEIWHCDEYDSFLDRAMTIGTMHCEPSIPVSEIEDLAGWFWNKKERGLLRRPGQRHWTEVVSDLLLTDRDAGAILHVLRVRHAGEQRFVIANAMADLMHMDRKLFAKRRILLREMGLIVQVYPDTRTKPALWRWP